MNNISFKQVVAVISGLTVLLFAAWKIDARYTTREIHELKTEKLKTEYKTMISDMQKQMIQIQKQQVLGNSQQQLWFWQQKVEEYTATCARQPGNQVEKDKLTDAKRQRDYWQREVHKLMNQ